MTAQFCKCGHRKNSHHLVKQKRVTANNAGVERIIHVTQSIAFKQKHGDCAKCDCKTYEGAKA